MDVDRNTCITWRWGGGEFIGDLWGYGDGINTFVELGGDS